MKAIFLPTGADHLCEVMGEHEAPCHVSVEVADLAPGATRYELGLDLLDGDAIVVGAEGIFGVDHMLLLMLRCLLDLASFFCWLLLRVIAERFAVNSSAAAEVETTESSLVVPIPPLHVNGVCCCPECHSETHSSVIYGGSL
jgi:hypothetical protein